MSINVAESPVFREVDFSVLGLARSSAVEVGPLLGTSLVAGISCGLVGVHILFSQMIFSILKLRRIIESGEEVHAVPLSGGVDTELVPAKENVLLPPKKNVSLPPKKNKARHGNRH